MTRSTAVALALSCGMLTGVLAAPASGADVRIGVNVGVPPVVVAPPAPVVVAPRRPVVVAPAPVVVAPAPPVVVAPGVPLYYYGNSYYTFYNNAWFVGPAYAGPWTFIPAARVPRTIVRVPRAYHHIPPGHAKHFAGAAPWAHGHGKGKANKGKD